MRPARLSELLVHVAETGSLWQAARQLADEFQAWLEKPDAARLAPL